MTQKVLLLLAVLAAPAWALGQTPGRAGSSTSPVASMARTLFDSGVVANGVAIDSQVLDLSSVRELEIFVDNTAGSAWRDLTFTSYLADGATPIDGPLLLRRVAWGSKANGADYDPGRARGYLGPAPAGFTSGAYVLYDVTSAVNTSLDTGALLLEDVDSFAAFSTSAGASSLAAYTVRDDGVNPAGTISAGAAATSAHLGGGLGTGSAPWATSNSVIVETVSRRVGFNTTAVVGQTVRLVVIGRGRHPGTFAVTMNLPVKGRVQLAAPASGTPNGRVVVVGR